MTLHWLLYCAALGTLLALAAAALDGGARALRLPTRWGWAAALALTVALPLAAWLRPSVPAVPVVPSAEITAVAVPRVAMLPLAESAEVAATALPWLAAAERGLIAGWGLASAAVLLWIAAMTAVLAYRRRRWTRGAAVGVPVMFAPDTGPAVVGLLRGRIVLPAWAREAEPRVLETMVAHEREHLRAGDHRLLALGLLVVAAMPWHPAAWWMLRRLRLAVEVDCDARVIRRADVHAYGRVLLEVGQRAGRLPLGAAALSQPVSFLERRIRIMTSPRVRFPRLRAGAMAVTASALVLAACEMSTPSGPSQVDTRRVYGDADAPAVLQPAETGPREAVLQYFPGLAHETGDTGANLVFVVAADGSIVQADRIGDASPNAAAGLGMGSRNETLARLGVQPDDIHTIEMIRFPAGTAAPVRVGVIWMRLKAATVGATEVGGRENIWPARISPIAVEGAEEAMVLRPLTPAEVRATPGATETVIVAPTRTDGVPSAESETRVLTLRPTRMVDGVGPDVLVVITDAAGNEVHRGAMPPASELNPDMIATVDVRKGAAATNPSGEIHIRLKD
jgi:type IV pilus biogenesis protein CpaD/CtpE